VAVNTSGDRGYVFTIDSPPDILRWLDEAQGFGSLDAYVNSLLGAEVDRTPLDRVAREAAHGARASLRGKARELVDAAVRRALRETVFRFELVMRINVTTHELLELEGLIDAALSVHIALLTYEGRDERRRDATYIPRFASLRHMLAVRLGELHAAEEARAIVETRYLDGQPALFPDAVTAWTEQLRGTEAVAEVASRLAELEGVPLAEPADRDALSARGTELVADLAQPAKATPLE
jgi:hypothetical protein